VPREQTNLIGLVAIAVKLPRANLKSLACQIRYASRFHPPLLRNAEWIRKVIIYSEMKWFRSIRHAAELLTVPWKRLFRKIYAKGYTTKSQDGGALFTACEENDMPARIVWSYSLAGLHLNSIIWRHYKIHAAFQVRMYSRHKKYIKKKGKASQKCHEDNISTTEYGALANFPFICPIHLKFPSKKNYKSLFIYKIFFNETLLAINYENIFFYYLFCQFTIYLVL
jgi:hypothetical protein